MRRLAAAAVLLALAGPACAQRPEDTEVHAPVPPVVTPGPTVGAAPSDAVVLFDGRTLDEWVNTSDKKPAGWADWVLYLTPVALLNAYDRSIRDGGRAPVEGGGREDSDEGESEPGRRERPASREEARLVPGGDLRLMAY